MRPRDAFRQSLTSRTVATLPGLYLNACAENVLTALQRAVSSKDNAGARLMLGNSVNVRLLTAKDQSALHLACMAAVDENLTWEETRPVVSSLQF